MEGTIVAVNKAKVYTIHKGGEWARITIEEWDGGGSFQCTSSFGNYNYIWGSIGDITLREFLCSLDYGYFYGKTSSNTTSGQRFSVEKTVAVMKEDVLGSRRNDGITETAAREYYNELNELLDHDGKSEFYSELFRTELFGEFYLGDYSSVYEQFENDPQCNGFWTVLWQDMCEFWKSELQKERPLESSEDKSVDMPLAEIEPHSIFEYFAQNYDLHLLDGEIADIINLVRDYAQIWNGEVTELEGYCGTPNGKNMELQEIKFHNNIECALKYWGIAKPIKKCKVIIYD